MKPNLTITQTTMIEELWTTVTTIETITICKNRTFIPTIVSSTIFPVTVDGEATATSICPQYISTKSEPLLGLSSTVGNCTVPNNTMMLTPLSNKTRVSSIPSLLVSTSSFSTGINATTKWGFWPNTTDHGMPPNPTSAFLSLGIKNKASIFVTAVIFVMNLVLE